MQALQRDLSHLNSGEITTEGFSAVPGTSLKVYPHLPHALLSALPGSGPGHYKLPIHRQIV